MDSEGKKVELINIVSITHVICHGTICLKILNNLLWLLEVNVRAYKSE